MDLCMVGSTGVVLRFALTPPSVVRDVGGFDPIRLLSRRHFPCFPRDVPWLTYRANSPSQSRDGCLSSVPVRYFARNFGVDDDKYSGMRVSDGMGRGWLCQSFY